MEKEKDILEKYSKTNPYKVPEGYFESLTDRINSRIDALEAEETATPVMEVRQSVSEKIWLTIKPVMYVAAVVALMVSITYLAIKPTVTEAENAEMALIEEQEYEMSDEDFDDFYFDDFEFDFDELEGLAYNK